MPMFYTPKPRQFRYQPRFYDPEKEKWEALKQKYADERSAEETANSEAGDVADLEYFQRRVREIDREERHSKGGLTWKDMFRKREVPQFNYQPRFSTNPQKPDTDLPDSATERVMEYRQRTTKIKRRYDLADKEYMKPMPAGRIMLYAFLVCLLLYWVLF
ncbi:MAG: hypothetical protein IJ745_08080 [Bacteroidales bacterium]|nr:hypothetical protein [Bacteroidales bacterium]